MAPLISIPETFSMPPLTSVVPLAVPPDETFCWAPITVADTAKAPSRNK
jgi:hypothetical protein